MVRKAIVVMAFMSMAVASVASLCGALALYNGVSALMAVLG